MKLILNSDVENLGSSGEIVEVKNGYGRNYLLPNGMAVIASDGAKCRAEEIRKVRATKFVRSIEHANTLKNSLEKIGKVSLFLRVASKTGKLFGSVTATNIVDAIQKSGGPELNKSTVKLRKGYIKSIGLYSVTIRLHSKVEFKLSIDVIAS